MAGFLLSQVDGRTPVSQLLQLSGQPRFDALEALYRLKSKGLIELSSQSVISPVRSLPQFSVVSLKIRATFRSEEAFDAAMRFSSQYSDGATVWAPTEEAVIPAG